MKNYKILITGVAGFIGAHLAIKLIEHFDNIRVIGIDNLNEYYSPSLKIYRLSLIDKTLRTHQQNEWRFVNNTISNSDIVKKLFKEEDPDIVINLAAQAGVRYSITNPDVYIDSNIIGFYNILEGCRHSYDNNNKGVKHLIFASSSSVYGNNKKIPYSTSDNVDQPVSLYAATKKSNEIFAYSYAKLYNIPTTGLRFFTVYGPAGRPDMAYFKFTNNFREGKHIDIYNYGNCKRDFTYIDDVTEGILHVINNPPIRRYGEDNLPLAPYSIYNIGNNQPESLHDFVTILYEELIKEGVIPQEFDLKEHLRYLPMQPGDVPITYANIDDFEKKFNFRPSTTLRDGISKFVKWYKTYYHLNNCNS